MAEATEQNSPQDLSSAASDLSRGSAADAVRVRRATELVRLWRRGSTAPGIESAATVEDEHARGAPAPAAAAPASTLPGVSPDSATAAPLSLADSRAAAEQLVQQLLQGQARNMTSVRLQLSPAELGHLQVDVRHRGDRLDIAFTTGHGAARELIEACLPSLKAMLHDAGIQVASVDVRHDPMARDGGRGNYGSPGHDGGQGGQSGDGAQSGGQGRQRDASSFGHGRLPVITPPTVADTAQVPLFGRIDAFA